MAEAARLMREADVGSLIVLEEGVVCGIVTDRDITIRVVAEERDIRTTPVGEICSREPLTLSVSDTIEQAIELMRSNFHTPGASAGREGATSRHRFPRRCGHRARWGLASRRYQRSAPQPLSGG
ncbi:MAG: CBS domain-containing protein [Candidatus Dormibacteraeota bacterium]|nr:CBS domain-containing protein [Candidatus Dormibacteraeota bacterium]